MALNLDHITRRPQLDNIVHKSGELLHETTHADENGAYTKKYQVLKDPFALDIGAIQSGWREFIKGQGRVLTLAPLHLPPIAKPGEKAQGVLVLPVSSKEMGGRCNMVLDNAFQTEGVQNLWAEVEQASEAQQGLIPVVSFVGDYDGVPGFEIQGWIPRQAMWGTRLFPAPKPKTNVDTKPAED